jgi:hypothetical protein
MEGEVSGWEKGCASVYGASVAFRASELMNILLHIFLSTTTKA